MRKIFSLLIILPLIINIQIPYIDLDFDWIDFDFNFDDLINKFKSLIPDFIKDMGSKLKDFMKKTEQQKNDILKSLDNTITELHQKILKQKENIENDVKSLVEKGTEVAKYLSLKVCNMAEMEYEECRNDKKKLLSNLLGAVKDNFGECSVIIGKIRELTENAEMNLKYILFLVDAISENPDALEKGKTQIVYDILNCLQDKLDVEIWPLLKTKLGDKEISIDIKKDVTNILVKSFSNMVNMIRFEEIDGYIEKANEKTGLISDSQAKKIHQGIFNVLKKLNEFGEGFYNVNSNLALNVIMKPDQLEAKADVDFQWINNDDKGIKIKLFTNYMFKETGANSLQGVVFDSPLVSVRATNEKEGGTSKTFVGITLYDKNGNEILVKDFNKEDLRPVIFFKKKLYNAMTTCLYYNEEDDTIENKGIISAIETFDGEEYIKCIPKHLTSFTIGSYEKANLGEKNYIAIIAICCSIGAVALLVGGFFLYRYLRKKHNTSY